MKTRTGFVSNSSSSSFVLKTKEDFKQIEQFNVTVYKVSGLVKRLSAIEDIVNDVNKQCCFFNSDSNNVMPFFICEQFSTLHIDYLDELKELLVKYPDSHITGEIDRDDAYRKNITLELFKGDL